MAFGEPTFDVLEIEHDARTVVLRVQGELHVSTAPRLREDLDRVLDRRAGACLVLDLGNVSFIDSTGLSVVLGAMRRVTRGRGRMALVCTNPTVLRLFEITRLTETLDICDDVQDAVALVHAGDQAAGGSTAGAP